MPFDIMQTILGEKIQLFSDGRRAWNQRFLWRKILSDHSLQTWILDLIREDQLFKEGIDEDGEVIGYYSDMTSRINPSKKFNTHYTLKDTGEFFSTFKIVVYPTYFEIDADAWKTNDEGETENLFYKYGEGIIGLTNENLEKLGQEILRRFSKGVRDYFKI